MNPVVEHTGTTWVSEPTIVKLLGINANYLKCVARFNYRRSLKDKTQLRLDILPDTGKSWRYAKFFDTYYYDLNRIPDRAPTYYRSRIPPVSELMEREMTRNERVEELRKALDEALMRGWLDYTSHYYGDSNREQLARGAACLATLAKAYRKAADQREFIYDAIHVCQIMSAPYLPSSYRLMKERIEALLDGKEIRELVFLPRAGNQNALKVTDPAILAWMVKLRAMPQNFTNAHIIRIIQTMCQITGKECPSASWFYTQLADNRIKFLTTSRWEGQGRHGNRSVGAIPIAPALFAGDAWQIDATRLNLIEHESMRVKGTEFLWIIAVRDVHSGDVLGVHFDLKEDRWGYFNVLKMAVSQAGYLPYELIIDRFPGHNTAEWQALEARLKLHGTKVTYTSKATGKAQIERWFSTLQTVFMQGSQYYYGEGVKSSRAAAHRSPSYLVAMRKKARVEGWDFDAAWQEGSRIVEAYRQTNLSLYSRKYFNLKKSPADLHGESEKPNVIGVEPWQFSDLFWLTKDVTVQRSGLIKIEVLKQEYHYLLDDQALIPELREVTLAYDLDDLSKVYLYTADERRDFLCEVNEMRAVQIYGPDADLGALSLAQSKIRQIEEYRKRQVEELTLPATNEPDLLMGGFLDKYTKENSETAYLLERTREWQDHGSPRIPASTPDLTLEGDFDEDEEVHVDVRGRY